MACIPSHGGSAHAAERGEAGGAAVGNKPLMASDLAADEK